MMKYNYMIMSVNNQLHGKIFFQHYINNLQIKIKLLSNIIKIRMIRIYKINKVLLKFLIIQ